MRDFSSLLMVVPLYLKVDKDNAVYVKIRIAKLFFSVSPSVIHSIPLKLLR